MKVRTLLLAYSFFFIFCSLSAQRQKSEVDSLITLHCNNENYYDAINEMSDYVIELSQAEDKEGACDYSVRICDTIAHHIQYFLDNGITLTEYYNYWKRVLIYGTSAGKKKDVIETTIIFLPQIQQTCPEEIPDFLYSSSNAFGDYTEPDYCDSVRLLQIGLDQIKKEIPTKEKVFKYVWLSRSFFSNRMFNSYNEGKFHIDRMKECDEWYYNNVDFINALDPSMYMSEILDYHIAYCNILGLRAGYYSTKGKDVIKGLELNLRRSHILESIKEISDTVDLILANCYGDLCSNYFSTENLAKCRLYSEKAWNLVNNSSQISFDYCHVLNSLANGYAVSKNYDKAYQFLSKYIEIRQKLGIEPTCIDYVDCMNMNQKDTFEIISLGEKLEHLYGDSDLSMHSVYLLLGNAYSSRMHAMRNAKRDYRKYKQTAEKYYRKAEKLEKKYLTKYEELGVTSSNKASRYSDISHHLSRQGLINQSLEYATRAADTWPGPSYSMFYDALLRSAYCQDSLNVRKYLPSLYRRSFQNVIGMLPLLGSIEGDAFLQNGNVSLYKYYEMSSWMPQDSLLSSTAYNVALLTKGLMLDISSIPSYIKGDSTLQNRYKEIIGIRNSILEDDDLVAKEIKQLKYEQEERELRQSFVDEQIRNLSVEWKDVQAMLEDDEVAIEIVGYVANNWNWMTADSIMAKYDAYIITKECTTPLLASLCEQKELLNVYDYQPKSHSLPSGESLYHSIWDKLEPYIKNKKNVYFSPMGLMCLVGIENLTDPEGIPALEKYNLRRVSSTKKILDSRQCTEVNTATLFGGISYSRDPIKSKCILDSLKTRGNWAYLQNTDTEIDSIYSQLKNSGYDVHLFNGYNAREEVAKESNTDILHFATHGFSLKQKDNVTYFANADSYVTESDLYYSGLLLAEGADSWDSCHFSIDANDGVFTAHEISNLNLSNVKLLVLSACETALGNRSYDGVHGLQRAFKMAGVKSIIMSLWKIDDEATSKFMTSFYSELVKDNDIHRSFVKAQKTIRELYHDPYYWASFILLD